MSRFNKAEPTNPSRTSRLTSPVVAKTRGRTYEGGPGYQREAMGELMLLAASYMGDRNFYEDAEHLGDRFSKLVHKVAKESPADIMGFTPWLRSEANMRTASLITAVEATRTFLDHGHPGGRYLVSSALQRADEPGEVLAYWTSRYGRTIPKPIKRGIADAILRLYTEFSLMRYDTDSHAFRFGDVIEMCHPTGEHPEVKGTWRGDLFEFALDRRHNRKNDIPATLPMIRANAALRRVAQETPEALLDSRALWAAGMTWEDTLSLAGSRVDKAKLWQALIPNMGYMALLRNLRNFDDAGVPNGPARVVASEIADPDNVARSMQFPFRFLAAYRSVEDSMRWSWPLEQALNLSLGNVPSLDGNTLVLVDRSLSMWDRKLSEHSTMDWADAAAVFGAALAKRAEKATLVEFSSRSQVVNFHKSTSVLKIVDKFCVGGSTSGPIGTGTDIPRAVKENLTREHTRVVIVTDEQTEPGVLPSNVYTLWNDADAMPPTKIDDLVPRNVPVYIWNFGGYRRGAMPSGGNNRHTFGGLSDAAFKMISVIEAGENADWPWAKDSAE